MNVRKKNQLLFLLIILALTNIEIFSQQKGTLRGVVSDSTSGEALAFGNVLIEELNTGASTDSRGYFIIPSLVANQTFTVVVSYIGYNTKKIRVKILPNQVNDIKVLLQPSSVQLETIEKVGERYGIETRTNISIERIPIKQLEALPRGVETDIFRSLQYLPGIQSTGDVSGRYYVRGGDNNQNLVLLNNAVIYNPFHALGIFGVVDPDMINTVEFFKGGFPAEYSGRLSSVMKIITKEGNKNKFGAKASASFLTSKLLLEGPIPNGSFIMTGRKSFSNSVLKNFFNEGNIPLDFHDLSFQLNYSNPDFAQGGKFTINGFFSNDKVDNNDPFRENVEWQNNIFGAKWFQVGDSPLFYEFAIYTSQFKGKVIPNFSDVRLSENEVTDITLQMDFSYVFDNKDAILVGFHVKQLETKLLLQNTNAAEVKLDGSGANISVYGKYKFLQFDNAGLDLGIRANLTRFMSQVKKSMVEPRLNFFIKPLERLTFKGAIGIYQQEITTLSDDNDVINVFDPFIITPNYLEPASSNQYIAGMEWNISNNLTFTSEAYYKLTKDLPVINQKKIFDEEQDFISAESEAYGYEFSLKYNSSSLNAGASYTLAYAYRKIDELLYYPRYDTRHTVNLNLDLNIGAGWHASAVWIYNSGLPFTQILGYYDKYYFDDLFAPWFFDPRKPYTILSVTNLGRLPDYHRLDLSLSKKLTLYFMNLELSASIINAYDRNNIFYFKRDTGERVNMLPFLPTATVRVEL